MPLGQGAKLLESILHAVVDAGKMQRLRTMVSVLKISKTEKTPKFYRILLVGLLIKCYF